jgi:hypothetical protein
MPTPKPPIDPPSNADNPEQSRRFIDMAREVEADETPGATDRALTNVDLRGSRLPRKPESGPPKR